MKAISTKYVGATNTRGSRIIASDGDGNRISIPYPHELSGEAVHRKAAEALRDKMKWDGELIGGATKDGYCFVFTDSPLPRRTFKNPRRRAKKRKHSERGFFPKRTKRQSDRAYSSRRLTARRRVARLTTRLGMRTSKAQRAITRKIHRNPSGIRIVYNRLAGGWYVVRGPHQTPLNGRFDTKAQAQAWLNRGVAPRRNPATQIKTGRGKFKDRYGATRSISKQTADARLRSFRFHRKQGYKSEGAYAVQVKRGAKWITLGNFPFHSSATDYGRALKHRYPGKSFRVFW